jgi:hypothetical protein
VWTRQARSRCGAGGRCPPPRPLTRTVTARAASRSAIEFLIAVSAPLITSDQTGIPAISQINRLCSGYPSSCVRLSVKITRFVPPAGVLRIS